MKKILILKKEIIVMRNNEHKKTPVNQIGGTNPFSEAKGFLSYFGY